MKKIYILILFILSSTNTIAQQTFVPDDNFEQKLIVLGYDNVLDDLSSWPEDKEPYYLGQHKCLIVNKEGIKLPNGLMIKYPGLEKDSSGVRTEYKYKSRRGEVSLWGGSVVENIVQALARIVIGEQIIKVSKKYKPVLTVHDAIVCIAPKEKAIEALDFIMETMSHPPEWGLSLPVTCEGAFADNYGDC